MSFVPPMQDATAPILLVEIFEHIRPNPRGNMHIRSYQARVTDRRRLPPQITELKVHLSIQAAVEDVLERMARTV